MQFLTINMVQDCNHDRQGRNQPKRWRRRRYSPSVKAAVAATFAIAVLSSTLPTSLSWTGSCFCFAESVDSEDIPNTKDELLLTLQDMKNNMNVTNSGLDQQKDGDPVDVFDEKIANDTFPSVESPVLESNLGADDGDDASKEAESEFDTTQKYDSSETSTNSDTVSSEYITEQQDHIEQRIGYEIEMFESSEESGEERREQIDEDIGETSIGDDVEPNVNAAGGSWADSDNENLDSTSSSKNSTEGPNGSVNDGDFSSYNINGGTNQKQEMKESSPVGTDESYIDLDEEATDEVPSETDSDSMESEIIDNRIISQNDNGNSPTEDLGEVSESISHSSLPGVDRSSHPDETDTNPSSEVNENSHSIDSDEPNNGSASTDGPDSADPSSEVEKNSDKSGSDNEEDSFASAEEKPPPKGSLASFFAEVSARENGSANQVKSSGGDTAGTRKINISGTSSFEQRAHLAEEMHVLENIQQQRMRQTMNDSRMSDSKLGQPMKLEDYPPKEYRGTWGIDSKRHRPADLDLLYLVFQDHIEELSGRTKYEYQEARFPIGINTNVENDDEKVLESEYDQMKAKVENEFPEAAIDIHAEPLKNSVNSDFVEGLDDIDKFFEGVDPPDELDIGASGSSMQEVLMGKGREILFKRIALGVRLVRSGLSSFGKRLSGLFHRFKDDDGEFLITKEQLKDMAEGLWRGSVSLYHRIVAFVDELIDGEDLDGEDLVDFNAEFEKLGLRDASSDSTESMRPPS